MRLIDADALKDTLLKYNYTTAHNQIFRYIDEQPTAFDTDKVVEQLKEERELSYADFDRYVEEVSPCLDAEYDDFFHRGLERAVKIVKGGVVDAGGNMARQKCLTN